TPTPTSTATPTATPTPTATATPTATPTPTPTHGCTYVGFWRCHPELWCFETLPLGNNQYSVDQVYTILHEPILHQNGLIKLAQSLIITKINILCNHTETSCIQQTVDDADALIGDLVIPPYGDGSLPFAAVDNLVTTLNHYNYGDMCAPPCDDPA